MAYISEMKFGDLQMEQQYKKLERNLKIASLRKGIRKGDDSWLSHMSPSISSINTDQFHSSTNTPYLQESNSGSEVISSSNNLRNILSQRKSSNSNREMIATSSVQKFGEENNSQTDRLVMPPPTLNKVLRSTKSLNCNMTYNVPKSLSTSQGDCPSPDINNESLKKKQNYKACNYSERHIDTFNSLQIPSDTCPNRRATVFTKWKVMLKEQSQLVIKGMVECGKIARSKPIVRRLTSTTVESVTQHLYCLQGNIIDDECELPDYIKGKFYNGFPDDWKNVCQIWKAFIQQRCSITFRWPTPITDSDDDLKSEVTDVTFGYTDSPEKEMVNLISSKESHVSRASVHTSGSYNTLETKNRQSLSSNNYKKRDSFTQTNISDVTENSLLHVNVQPSKKWCNNDKENFIHPEDVHLNWSGIKNEENGLKDKLSVFINNLTNKNCSEECISKVIDCLNYVVSCSSSTEHTFNIKSSKLEKSKERNYDSVEYRQSESFPSQNNIGKIMGTDSVSRRKRTFAEMNETNSSPISDSENEVYAGIRKISTKGMIRQKEALTKPYKRKLRKRTMRQKYDNVKERYTLNIFPTTSDSTKESCRKTVRAEDTNGIDFDDSSISIMEDERNDLVKLQTNNNEHLKSDILTSCQWEKSNDSMKNKKTHEMQEHFVKENSPATWKSTKHLSPPYEIIENEKHEISMPKRRANETREANLSVDSGKKKESENIKDRYQNHLLSEQYREFSTHSKNNKSRIPKPVIISTVPVDINITKEIANCSPKSKMPSGIVNKDKTIERLNEESKQKSVTEEESPRKSDAIRKSNLNSLTDSKQYHEENNSVELKILSPINLKLFENKPKLLSAWKPRVLFNSELQLIFEGNLLNEVGHIVEKKFRTDKVLRRISSKLIETVNHEFYQLIGDLHDTNHVVPKELLNQCRYGCPSRIQQFCKKWKLLESAVSSNYPEMKELNDTLSINGINVATSSKGERVISKEDSVVYKPGISSDYSMLTHGSPDKGKYVKKSKKQQIKDKSKEEHFYQSDVSVDTKESYNLMGKRDVNRESISPSKQMSRNLRSSAETYRDLVCKYYQGIPVKDDVLSDDQISHVFNEQYPLGRIIDGNRSIDGGTCTVVGVVISGHREKQKNTDNYQGLP
ncbi:hypothetical protein ANTPLA_LOCUS8648 [Anthophora plagiata]